MRASYHGISQVEIIFISKVIILPNDAKTSQKCNAINYLDATDKAINITFFSDLNESFPKLA